MMDDYKNSDNFQRTEGCKMISPHHFHPTKGGSPAESKLLGLFDEHIIVWDGEEYLGVPYKHEPIKFYLILE